MIVKAYQPLLHLGRVFYLPTSSGFILYNTRTKTALLSTNITKKVIKIYKKSIKPEGKWTLPSRKIEIKDWICANIPTDEQEEIQLFYLMGYHYNTIKPKKFWEGLMNLDPRFEHFTYATLSIKKQKHHLLIETPPFPWDKTLNFLARTRGEYLTEKLIREIEKKTKGDKQ